MVASDRISAFDVIFDEQIPNKGKILTEISNFWFEKLSHLTKNHLTGDELHNVLSAEDATKLQGRAVIVQRLKPLPIESIVRGYVAGSGWKEYMRKGSICDIDLPEGLLEASKLPSPIFTPSTKASLGEHDESISYRQSENILGVEIAAKIRTISLELYAFAADYALTRGIIIADTKFEFGLDSAGNLVLMDEVLTPDSSRFWPMDQYCTGESPASFDKQILRDWLESMNWNKQLPAPHL
ncbi:UNVERIFIED_CONTAM: hypothetical protein GTU68_008994, partial [Idotea baltica]|nr:hypothetical protein [Idotea baltica]